MTLGDTSYDGTEHRIVVVGTAVGAAGQLVVGMSVEAAVISRPLDIAVGCRLQVQGDGAAGGVGRVRGAAVDRLAVMEADLTAAHDGGHFHHRRPACFKLFFETVEVAGKKIEMVVLRPSVTAVDERNRADGLVHVGKGHPGGEHFGG